MYKKIILNCYNFKPNLTILNIQFYYKALAEMDKEITRHNFHLARRLYGKIDDTLPY